MEKVTFLSAMACGIPVIATNVSDVPILVKSGVNGIVISLGKADILAESIIHLAENQALRRLVATANIRKTKDYDWDI